MKRCYCQNGSVCEGHPYLPPFHDDCGASRSLCFRRARLRADRRFGLLSPAHQFDRLADEVEKEGPAKAATMREWSPAAKDAMIKWLNDVLIEDPHPTNQQELWRVRKGDRQLTCLAVYLPTGIELRLMEGADFRRTQLLRDALALPAIEAKWKRALHGQSWEACDRLGQP